MNRPAAALSFTMAIAALSFGACASPSAKSSGQNDVWEITLNAKSHTHSHGSSSGPNEQKLSDTDLTYTLSLTERVHVTSDAGRIELGGDDSGGPVGVPTGSGTASEQFHSRAEIQRDLQEQWTTRQGTLNPPPSGAGAHFAWDGSARQGVFEASAHYTGTEESRTHVVNVGNNVDRTDRSSGKWLQSALFGGDSKHPVTVQQTKTGFTIDWSWTESTRDPSGATKEVAQSGHADVRPH